MGGLKLSDAGERPTGAQVLALTGKEEPGMEIDTKHLRFCVHQLFIAAGEWNMRPVHY
jgi:hypothetical protein